MSANLDLVRSILARWERGEMSLSAWADCADPEIEVTVVGGPEPSSHKSVANAAPAVDAFLSLWDEYRVEAEEYRELDDARVLVLTRQSGRGKGSGVTTEERRATLFHIRDGRITRRVNYWDRERALADLGLEG